MGFKEALAKFAEKQTEKKRRFKELEEKYRMMKKLEERQKSSNERELERYLEEKRQERIKQDLDVIREQKKKEFWQAGLFKSDNIFKGQNKILKQPCVFGWKGNMLKSERSGFGW